MKQFFNKVTMDGVTDSVRRTYVSCRYFLTDSVRRTYVSCRYFLTDFATFVDEDGCVLTGWLIRNYCEKVKRSKHIIDGFPNTKQVAMWLLEK